MSKGYVLNMDKPDEKYWFSLDEFEEFAKTRIAERFKADCERIQNDNELMGILDQLFCDIINLQEKGEKASIRYIHFFFLGSSIITDSNEIQINLFSNESYMDKKETMRIWHPNFILDYHIETVRTIDKLAKEHVRGYSHEQYMDLKIWSNMVYCIKILDYLSTIAPQIFELDSYKKMNKECDIQMFFGGYMNKAIEIE